MTFDEVKKTSHIDVIKRRYGITDSVIAEIEKENPDKTYRYGVRLDESNKFDLVKKIEEKGYGEAVSPIKGAITIAMDASIVERMGKTGLYASSIIEKGVLQNISELDAMCIDKVYSSLDLMKISCNKRVSLPIDIINRVKQTYGPDKMINKFYTVAAVKYMESIGK